jgi:2-polyprenyl-3-methyl-5-hydroxy-6-metoxy-1,4-benzoquinol methylase
MQIVHRVIHKAQSIYFKLFRFQKGYGKRVAKIVWEKQYKDRFWDYLAGDEERKHYEEIVRFYQKYGTGKSILDIGCGHGVLYGYLDSLIGNLRYAGVDIAQQAIQWAKKLYPSTDFSVCDFQYESLNQKADVIIFNETLYYFNKPLQTLEKCIKENLNANGIFIISMCDYSNHELIWEQLATTFTQLDAVVVSNEKGQLWKVKVFRAERT